MSSAVGIKCRNALTEVPDTEAGGGGGGLFLWTPVIVSSWCPWIVMYWKTVLCIVIEMHSVTHELPNYPLYSTHTLRIDWRNYIINLATGNNLNQHLEAWFNFTFDFFDVSSTTLHTVCSDPNMWPRSNTLFCDSWNTKLLFVNSWPDHPCPRWYCTYLPRTVEYVELAKAATCASRTSGFLQTVGVKIILHNSALWTLTGQREFIAQWENLLLPSFK